MQGWAAPDPEGTTTPIFAASGNQQSEEEGRGTKH